MLKPSSAYRRSNGRCPVLPYAQKSLDTFEAQDALFSGKTYAFSALQSLDQSDCSPITRDGVAKDASGRCIDFGVSTISHVDPIASGQHASIHPLEFLPETAQAGVPNDEWQRMSTELQRRLEQLQFPGGDGACGVLDAPEWRKLYFVAMVPQLGFGSVVEYGMMFLARSVRLGAQLVLGQRSAPVWTSPWACGAERSLTCYFNVSGCCGSLSLQGRELQLPRRRNPLNLGLEGFNRFGAAWLSGQLAHFFFRRLTTPARQEIERRQAAVRRPSPGATKAAPRLPSCIGMHIRGGDACHNRRYCPSNLTATFFAQAARMRRRYGVSTIVLATDSTRAAELCARGVLGFDCRTLRMTRDKFDSATFIEHRVAANDQGPLSGSTVALDALADIDLLADCDVHILMLRSAISRLAYALSLARHGRPTPLVSMHMPYSSGGIKGRAKRAKLKAKRRTSSRTEP